MDEDQEWITTENNVHVPLNKGESKKEACEEFFEDKEKAKNNIQQAINDILNNKSDEIIVKNVRNDLQQYGGSNDVAFIKGTNKGGVSHFSTKHKDDIDGIIETLVNGKVTSHVPNRKVYIENNDYLALLSLDYFGNKKTWLLTGYKKDS